MFSGKMSFFVVLGVILFSSLCGAESVWFEDDGAEWQETLWYPHKEDPTYHPGAGDEAYVGWGKTAYIRSSSNEINVLGIGAANVGDNALYIESGGITVGNKIKFQAHAGADLLEISGGSLSVANYVNGWNSSSIFRVVGGESTLDGTAHFNGGCVIEFVIDSTGITAIPWSIGFMSAGTISLKADGAAPGTYTLFGNIGDNTFKLTTEYPGEGLYWVTDQLWPDGTVTIAEASWASHPDPADEELYVPSSRILSWDAPAPGVNPDPLYDIYFGSDANSLASPVVTGSSDKFYEPNELEYGTKYYWKVDVQGNDENEVMWSFTTEPLKSIDPGPSDGQTGVAPETALSWDSPSSVADPSFEVWVSEDPNDPNTFSLVYSGPDKIFEFDGFGFSTSYKWRVDLFDNGTLFEGDVWTFETKDAAGKVLEWSMDETSGTMVPDTAGSNHGTAANGPAWVPGLVGNCLRFSDNGETVSKLGANGLPLGGDDSWSMNMYLFLEQPFAHWTVLGGFGLTNPGGGKGRFIMNMNNVVTFWPQGATVMSNTGFDVGWWQMITVTYDGATVRMYKNGVEISSQAYTLFDADPEVWLSPLDVWGQGYVNGKIDEFTIWDDALTTGEIDALASIIPVRGDMDDDGDIDMVDLQVFAGQWLPIVGEGCVGGSVVGDFNGDCAVNLVDFSYIAESWMD